MSPFSGEGLEAIRKRSKGRSELTGRTDRPLDAMHFNHRRRDDYNEPTSGMRVTIVEHLAYHLYYQENPEEIGLKRCQNDFAIDALNRRCVQFLEKVGHLDDLDGEIAEATILWETVLNT